MKHKNLPTIHHRPHQRAGYPLPTTSYLLPTKKAYTIIELLTVLAIMLVIAAMTAPVFGRFTRSVRLRSVTRIIANNLITARSMAITNRAIYNCYVAYSTIAFETYIRDDATGELVGKRINLAKYGNMWVGGAPVSPPPFAPPLSYNYHRGFKFTGAMGRTSNNEIYIYNQKEYKQITVTNTTGRVKIKN